MNQEEHDYASILLIETGRFSDAELYTKYFKNPSVCNIPHLNMCATENTGDRDTFTIGDLSIPRAQLKPTNFLNIPEFDIQLYDITATPLGAFSFDLEPHALTSRVVDVGALGIWVVGHNTLSNFYTTRFFSWKYHPECLNSLRVLRFARSVEFYYVSGQSCVGKEMTKFIVTSGPYGYRI